jgi:hypothetical protein
MRFIAAAIVGLALTMSPVFPGAADGGTQVMNVAVYADGHIVADGHEIALPALRQAFARVSKAHGRVLYYREAPESEPHPNAMAVMQAIIEARLPVSLSSKPDFSNVMLPDGTAKMEGGRSVRAPCNEKGRGPASGSGRKGRAIADLSV